MSEYEDWTPLKDTSKADRRERIATAALQGLLHHPTAHPDRSDTAADAVGYADALITALDKQT